ncbi:ABC transporter ATP-binding protein [Beijerinckiaceae bacterium RH AL1]|nr:AarF/UbiB family protein [Beijerinckiaceae bacterium]VVB46605.1 ABC transporter ATP-binding protein [Beijerinckiaceae bacterium RH CH11]VVB46690.1 ABC transporter ATP-binding protein [Beijerinckiaceae bacterium RH AL8]VVC55459.1 ABC transporter ATP-binding protein [Beijerinckiaceae bacterium RH AL1]
MADSEANRFTARAARYARVGANMGGVAARMASGRLFGRDGRLRDAAALTQALGGLKGPLMKVAQMMATIPDLLPPEYAEELQTLQSDAPPMGAAFVKRRMIAELGADWRQRFGAFDLNPAAAASLGQVHKATTTEGAPLACKLQYPDMQSAVEADLKQLDVLFGLHRQFSSAIDTREIKLELGDRLREELDYAREAKHAALYGDILRDSARVRVPAVHSDLSTRRLLTLGWLDGEKLLDFKSADEATRNRLAEAMFEAWWYPMARYGVIHGDPHPGNYSVWRDGEGTPAGINLLDYGCIRIFPAAFAAGVVELYRGFLSHDEARIVHAYELWGFKNLRKDLIETLNIWARFIYAPLLEDRVRTVADGIAPGHYGRREAFQLHQALREKGPVTVPREFVFMDRAAIGLGSVFLHLDAKLNFHRLYEALIEDFSAETLADRQAAALARAGLAAA